MQKKLLSDGTAHTLPNDLHSALASKNAAQTAWESLTPLARNEWICWTVSVKKEATRKDHVRQVVRRLLEGERRPCCWVGCIHRTDKKISPSVKAVLERNRKR